MNVVWQLRDSYGSSSLLNFQDIHDLLTPYTVLEISIVMSHERKGFLSRLHRVRSAHRTGMNFGNRQHTKTENCYCYVTSL